ncbi:endo-1,4-beta-xylanase [Spirosoma sordidisoli]|uniref:endo-1,4-beta-xylanase n=1 Tax=Spirosoma sordidisoli TaxID=2502893 RepID=A0A4Q2USE8_9BACT|nr:endo-1,4-beta-xylanase [Spirosoma sordidisoli]RYC70801.1 glycoside hydrolase family 10 [Spirosoma sordidisoli]
MKQLVFATCLTLSALPLSAQLSDDYKNQWASPAVQQRIADGIREHRMGNFTVRFTDKDGNPVSPGDVSLTQTRHDFHFGANGFMVKGFKNPKEDALYEEHFARLFNFVTIPFYWPELEPEPGKLRFDKDSPYSYRRPAPDLVMEFARKHAITPKGHTLVWDNPRWSIPTWLPKDEKIMEQKISKRIEQIAQRYGHEIQIWDVVNEVTDRHADVLMPKDFAFKAFKESERVFPNSNVFTLNFTTAIWKRSNKREYSADYLLTESLLRRNAKINAIGLQFHNFSEPEYEQIVKGKEMTPTTLFNTLDLYSDFNLPLHITEITVSALSDKGPDYQAVMAENYYKLWFSHPKVEAIIWWNLVDGTAAPAGIRADGSVIPGEDKWKGGLLNRDFTKKPVYDVLDRLINKEWRTNLTVKPTANGASYRGFYGTYKLVTQLKGKTYEKEIQCPKSGTRDIVVVLD